MDVWYKLHGKETKHMSHMAHAKRPADIPGFPPLPAPNDRGIVEFPTSLGWASPERRAVVLANIAAVKIKPGTGVSRAAAEALLPTLAWHQRFFREGERPTLAVEPCDLGGFVVKVTFPHIDHVRYVRTEGEWNACYSGMGVAR